MNKELKKMKKKDIQLLAEQFITGDVVTRSALAGRLGYQYGTDRDIYEALGYPVALSFEDYGVRYTRQDIAKAVIVRPAEATWRGGFKIVELGDKEETKLETAFALLNKKFKLSSTFLRLDKLTCIGEYGVLLLGFDDVKTQADFKEPVQGKRKLLYMNPYSQGSCEIEKWETDTKNERYNLPLLYKIDVATTGSESHQSFSVHHSRIIHVADDLLESDTLGTPVLKPIFNRMMDLEKLTGGSAEMFWRGARPGYQGKIDPEYTMTAEAKEDLQDQIDEYEHHLRRVLIGEGLDLKELGMQVADPRPHVDIQIQMISALTGIPKRILTGTERGELASTQDREAWKSKIDMRRGEYAAPIIIEPFIDRLIMNGVLPAAGKDGFVVEWAPLYEESDKDKAEVGKTRATALKEYSTNPEATVVVPPDAFYKFFLGFTDDQIEQIEEMQETYQLEEADDLEDEPDDIEEKE